MNAIIIDDERLARSEIRRLLQSFPEIQIVAEASNCQEAKQAVSEHDPDLLFLDIKMPGKSGFDLLEEIDPGPAVIFTTAYDEFAIRAFEVNALDYLLKPIEPKRLQAALAKVFESKPAGLGDVAANRQILTEEDRVFVKDGDRCWLLRLGDVSVFESEGNYTRIVFEQGSPLVYRSLHYLQERLDGRCFFRANRRQIVNLKKVSTLEPWPNGGIIAVIKGGHKVEMSRRRARQFREAMIL